MCAYVVLIYLRFDHLIHQYLTQGRNNLSCLSHHFVQAEESYARDQ